MDFAVGGDEAVWHPNRHGPIEDAQRTLIIEDVVDAAEEAGLGRGKRHAPQTSGSCYSCAGGDCWRIRHRLPPRRGGGEEKRDGSEWSRVTCRSSPSCST